MSLIANQCILRNVISLHCGNLAYINLSRLFSAVIIFIYHKSDQLQMFWGLVQNKHPRSPDPNLLLISENDKASNLVGVHLNVGHFDNCKHLKRLKIKCIISLITHKM